jgi:hypothetical protein
MPNIDISRDATDLRKHYDGVHMQQGRVLTDDDFNEAARLDAEDERRVRVDVIGPAGSPDDGFRLKVNAGQLLLSAGTYYTGGLRLELEADEAFNLQRDWLQQGTVPGETLADPGVARFDFVWLDVWQQPVAAVEDKELLEAALGGADTSTRVRTMRRARILPNIGDVDCAAAWTQLQASLATQGVINGDFELVPDARLTVGPDGTTNTDDLCSPPVAGGYLGAENQAIRVQITGANQFTWGFDNGAPLYRVQLLADGGGINRRIKMLTLPKDQSHYPLEGQVVELLPWSALLSNGQKNAELSGFLAKVNGGYNPDTQELFITAAPPNDTGTPVMPFGQRWTARTDATSIHAEAPPEDVYFYMRVWNRGADTQSPAAIAFNPGAPVPLTGTGLQVTFAGAHLRKNDFWIIAARPETPNTVVPWELSTGRAPHGVRRWIAPLGVIHWRAAGAGLEVLDDCRPTFLPLTRIKGCCSYTVGDGTHSYGNFSRIQDAVNALPLSGGEVCVLAGIYDESVTVSQRVSIRIHGCGPRTRVRAVAVNQVPLPAFLVSTSSEIVLDNMAIESGPRSAVRINNSRHVTVSRCLIQMRDLPTLWQAIYSRGDDILIEDNTIEVLPRDAVGGTGPPPVPTIPPLAGSPGAPIEVHTPPDPIWIGSATRGGIQLAGGSDRVRVLRNVIRGGTWNGITLGSLHLIGSVDPEDTPDRPDSEDECAPCKPVDVTDDPDPASPGPRYESAGSLYDVEIAGNQISDMGINGIGVVRFFSLANGGEVITVKGLHITDNLITRCMRRDLAQVSQAMLWLVAYGGIALGYVSDLRVLRNEIVANGTNHLQPICGVFALLVLGLQVDDNRIIDNGSRDDEPVANAQNGLRGGVHVWFVLPVQDTKLAERSLFRKAITTVAVRDNVISVPLGRSLTFFAFGPVVVARNRLLSEGTTAKGLDLLAASVLIGNLGISNEWTIGLVQALSLGQKKEVCDPVKKLGLTPGSPLTRVWPTGKTLIAENQITLDVVDDPFDGVLASTVVLSLDDVGFTDNQCEVTTSNIFFATNAALIGGSVRVADNRFSETFMRAKFSSVSFGLMNTTTDNQATHCLFAKALLPPLRVFRDNTSLFGLFCSCPDQDTAHDTSIGDSTDGNNEPIG